MKCLVNFAQSAVIAEREEDGNFNSGVVTETMKLLENSCYGYQIMDRSRHTVTKYPSDEKLHGGIKIKMCKRLGYINDQLYRVELVKSEIEQKELNFVGFFLFCNN